ncbi:unnamed protein product [Effrenium voratum]|uniref:Uncharacterized protein n=1 Tax=Effrenium voratum TaxID=2562239 RepID=A0AA36J882_9DINO|nr:unnamed protein product [Effrenium voratum]
MALLSSLSLSLLREKDKPRKSEPDAKPKPKPKPEVAPSRARPEPEAQVKPPAPKPAPASPLPPSLPAAPASASSDAGDSQPKAMSSLLGAYSDSEEETQVKPISSAAAAVVATAGANRATVLRAEARQVITSEGACGARGAHGACDARLKAGRFGGQAGAANCAEGPSGESAGHHAIPQISDVRLAEALRNMKFLKRALTLSSCRKLRCVTVAAGSLAVGPCYVWMACDLCLQEHVIRL